MREFWNKTLGFFKRPPTWFLVSTYIVTVLSCTGAICILAVDYESNALAIAAYSLFALAAISLAYSVYTIVKVIPKIKRSVIERLERNKFTGKLLRDYGFRTVIFACGSFVFSVAYGIFNGAQGILSRSIWFSALAAYYIILAFLRGGILLYHRSKMRNLHSEENDKMLQVGKYKTCGILLTVLHLALSVAIAQMIFSNKHFEYENWTIFAHAAYTFFKITMATVNIFKARKQDDLTVQAIRCINLTDAMVSVLALQTALLYAFTETNSEVNVSLFNTLTGAAVSLFCLSLGIFMIIKATKIRKKLLLGESNE